MQSPYTIAQTVRKQLLNLGYNSIVILNKHEGPQQCFLSKKDNLPEMVLKTNFLMVSLFDSYALDIIKKHFDDKSYIIRSIPSMGLLQSSYTLIDDDYFFEITEDRWLHIYKRGESIDTIDLCDRSRRCYMYLKEFIEEDVVTKSYFSLPFGYSLMRYLQKTLPFEEFDLVEIFYNYENEEAIFETTCFQLDVKYLPNLSLSEKYEYLEGATGGPVEFAISAYLDHLYYKCQVNVYYKMAQLGFINTSPFGELYEPFKIDLGI